MKKTTLLPVDRFTCHASLRTALGFLAVLAFGPTPAHAAVTEAWVHRSCTDEQPVKVVRDAAGDIIVTGLTDDGTTSLDILTTKYSGAHGAVLWRKRYNGPANRGDAAYAVAVDGSGNVVVTGYSNNGTNYDCYTAKYAGADGGLLWEKRYNGPANSYDEARAVAVDHSGNVLVTGSCATVKYAAADGALLWENRHKGPAYGDLHAVAVDRSGNVVVTGVASTFIGSRSEYDYYTAKYAAADGALLWEQRYDGPANFFDFASAVTVDGSDNVVVTGYSYGTNFNADYYTAKYAAADGALVWENRYNGPANGDDTVADGHSLALGPNGMVAVTGTSGGNYATLVYWENLPPISIALVPAGIRLRFTGVPGRSHTLEHALAVTGPWTIICTQTAPASGLLEYLHARPPTGQAFYRAAQP